jgi:hypothetical protein
MLAEYSHLAKAFNFVNHDILLAKLYFYGVKGTVSNSELPIKL